MRGLTVVERARPSRRGGGWAGGPGQAALELVAGVPLLLLAALVGLQLLVAGYSLTLADGAVEAGASALAAGRSAPSAVRAALPGWAGERSDVDVSGGQVRVSLRPLALLGPLARHLEVTSTAWARRPAEP